MYLEIKIKRRAIVDKPLHARGLALNRLNRRGPVVLGFEKTQSLTRLLLAKANAHGVGVRKFIAAIGWLHALGGWGVNGTIVFLVRVHPSNRDEKCDDRKNRDQQDAGDQPPIRRLGFCR